jgi:hypothetical protein
MNRRDFNRLCPAASDEGRCASSGNICLLKWRLPDQSEPTLYFLSWRACQFVLDELDTQFNITFQKAVKFLDEPQIARFKVTVVNQLPQFVGFKALQKNLNSIVDGIHTSFVFGVVIICMNQQKETLWGRYEPS